MSKVTDLHGLQAAVWEGSLPLEIRLAPTDCRVYDQADPYLIHYPRLSYLPFLLPRLLAFFAPFLITPHVPAHDAWFSFEGVPLKWHYPVGLLYDLFSSAAPAQAPSRTSKDDAPDEDLTTTSTLPWKLQVHFSAWPDEQLVRLDAEGKVLHDAYINSVKEADFLRNGTAKGIMTLSKGDSTQLWRAVQDHDFTLFNPLYQRLLHAQGSPLRHIPLRIYLPASPSPPPSQPTSSSAGHLKVIQSLIPPLQTHSREPQTVGTALHTLLPSLFPSRRTPVLAKAVLHGAVLPMGAVVEELLREAAYADGWLGVVVVMIG